MSTDYETFDKRLSTTFACRNLDLCKPVGSYLFGLGVAVSIWLATLVLYFLLLAVFETCSWLTSSTCCHDGGHRDRLVTERQSMLPSPLPLSISRPVQTSPLATGHNRQASRGNRRPELNRILSLPEPLLTADGRLDLAGSDRRLPEAFSPEDWSSLMLIDQDISSVTQSNN